MQLRSGKRLPGGEKLIGGKNLSDDSDFSDDDGWPRNLKEAIARGSTFPEFNENDPEVRPLDSDAPYLRLMWNFQHRLQYDPIFIERFGNKAPLQALYYARFLREMKIKGLSTSCYPYDAASLYGRD